MSALYPLRFKPVYKDYVWGGDKIIQHFHRDEPHGVYAESWEVADRPEGMSVVANGTLEGKTLHELVATLGPDLLGKGAKSSVFPLLIKIIDARETLSIQVHPDDAAAKKYGGEPKTEMWYVLQADPGAHLFCGLKSGTTPEKFKKALQEERVPDLLQRISVSAGDSLFVPGGRVHAIGPGCLLLEVQQNSNTTYRIFDWGRKGRELHIEQALKVIRWDDHESAKIVPHAVPAVDGNQQQEILSTPQFKMERMVLKTPQKIERVPRSFQVLFIANGNAKIDAEHFTETVRAGVTYLVPAALDHVLITPLGGGAEVLRITR